MDKARNYIVHNFEQLLTEYRQMFFKNANNDDFKLLLSDNRLNVDNKTDIYNLIIEWCLKTKNYEMVYNIAVKYVHFNVMNKEQLLNCLFITKNLCLKKMINHIRYLLRKNIRSIEYASKPKRSISFEFCAILNEDFGVYLYRWDWDSLKFKGFL